MILGSVFVNGIRLALPGGLTFLAPLVLIGLISLPLIWWLLRVTPPQPKNAEFPPLRILRDVVTEEETPDSTPLWLLLFRLLMLAIIIFALARPIIERAQGVEDRRLVLVIENNWAAASNWGDITREAEARIADARRKNLDVLLITSAEPASNGFSTATEALQQVKALTPVPYWPDLLKMSETLDTVDIRDAEVVWLSSGVETQSDEKASQPLSTALKKAQTVERLVPNSETLPAVPLRTEETANGLRSVWRRMNTGSLQNLEISLSGRDSRTISREDITFLPGEDSAAADFDLPAELRNRVASIRAGGIASAGSVALLDDRWGRPLIGLLTVGDGGGSPLLTEAFYAETALAPYADIFSGQLSDLLPLSPSIIIMPDSARIETQALTEFVESGGLLIRFAGPKLAQRSDTLLPVDLRSGGRDLGGALTWEDPQSLSAFTEESPFYGLNIPEDTRVTRQLMAEPGTQTDNRTWARLSDGSPVVTSAPRGLGRVVLFHVTAGPEWSNLAVGGLYVEMLRRLLPLAKAETRESVETTGDWVPERVLNGFGRLTPPEPSVLSIPAARFETAVPTATTPPGLYRQGTRRLALNTVTTAQDYRSVTPISGVMDSRYGETVERSLTGLLLGIALFALAVDALIALFISGKLGYLKPRRWSLAFVFIGVVMATAPLDTTAQTPSSSDGVPEAALGLYLAYVETGDARVDEISEAAMTGLKDALTNRTTIEPEGVTGVDIGTDDLVFYPFLYFPVSRDTPELSPEKTAALNAYMAGGGTLVFDTQDQGDKAITGGFEHPGLSRVTKGLDMPTIGKVPSDHVLTKSFYLIQVFPGRWANGTVWVDKNQTGGSKDGVSRVIIGSNDWAAGWATTPDGSPFATLENDIPKQREMALRFGVNLAMYALAGNYKADQVHTAELIPRLGLDKKDPQNLGPRVPTE